MLLKLEQSVRDGRFEEAYDALKNKKNLTAQECYLLGRCYSHHVNDIEAAINYYSQAINKGSDSLDCILFRAHAYYLLDETTKSILDIKHALSKAPGHEWAMQQLFKCSRKIVAQNTTDRDESSNTLNTMIDVFSSEYERMLNKKSLHEDILTFASVIGNKVDGVSLKATHNSRMLRINQNDIKDIANNTAPRSKKINTPLNLTTSHPVAIDSADHLVPNGTTADNSRHPQFVRACERLIGKKVLTHMDMGCAGGGLVYDFLQSGHNSIGLEGSNAPLLTNHACWPSIPHHLNTCDISHPFQITDAKGAATLFDIITSWEVLEHIAKENLVTLFTNIRKHLTDDGYFVGSISQVPDVDDETGAIYHVTLESQEWWEEMALSVGLKRVKSMFMATDYVRGSGQQPPLDDDFRINPTAGFHIVLQKTT